MGNALSCLDPVREHPPYSWPKDHPNREAAIADRRRRRSRKIIGAQRNAQTVETAPSKPSVNVVPDETKPLTDKVAEEKPLGDKKTDVSAVDVVDNKPTEPITIDENPAPPVQLDDDKANVVVADTSNPLPTSTDKHLVDDIALDRKDEKVEALDDHDDKMKFGDVTVVDTEFGDEIDDEIFEDEPRAERDARLQQTPFPDLDDEIQPVVIDADVEDDKADEDRITTDPTAVPIPIQDEHISIDKDHVDVTRDDGISADYSVEATDTPPAVRETEVVDVDIGVPPSMVDTSPKQTPIEEVSVDEPADQVLDIEEEADREVEPLLPNDINEKPDDAPPVPENPVDGATAAHDVQDIMNEESPKDEDIVTDDANLPSIDTRRAIFDRAEDRLPEVKEVRRDVLDPVTNEYTSLEEYRRRQRDRAHGVVRERVEKFEEIDDARSKQIAEHAAIEAARAEAIGNAKWTFKSKPDLKSPGLSAMSSSSANDLSYDTRPMPDDANRIGSDDIVLPSEISLMDTPNVTMPPIGSPEEPVVPPIGTAFPPVEAPISSVDAVVDDDSITPNDNLSQVPPPSREPLQVPEIPAMESTEDKKKERIEAPLWT